MSDCVSLEEAKARLSRIGKTAGDLARELGVSNAIVRGVLDGRFKGTRGDAHKVAVALGLKEGIIVADGASIADAMKAAAA
jgi:gp16 family phage-associated protein